MLIFHPNTIFQNVKNNLYRLRHNYSEVNKKNRYKTRKLLGFSTHEIYDVVADIKNYDKFLPFCTKATVSKQDSHHYRANLEIGFPPWVENYTSIVKLIESNLVQSKCYDGKVFDYLESTWVFDRGLESNPKTCIADYTVEFSFKSKFYSTMVTLVFEKIVMDMEKAFIDETVRRYGKPSVPARLLTPYNVSMSAKAQDT